MKSGIGILLILVGVFTLWLYNTGRLAAVVSVVKSPTAPTNGTGNPGSGTAHAGTGGTTLPALSNCGAAVAAGGVDPSCFDVWKGLNSPSDIVDTITNGLGDIFKGLF